MMNFKTALLVGAAALLTACATATPYQPAAKAGASGYTTTQIESNRFNISFAGNSLTDRETVETYLLYRAAELAVNNGYDYFTVAEKETDKSTRVVSTPSSLSYGHGYAFYPGFYPRYNFYHPRLGWSSSRAVSRYRNRNRIGFGSPGFRRGFYDPYYDPFWRDVDYREITKFTANAQVLMGRGSKPSNENAFNAREVLQNLSSKVIFPEEKG